MKLTSLHNPNALYILNMLHQENFEAYLVGGCVRDALLGRDIHDFDITTSAPVKTLMELAKQHDIHVIPTGIKHGTLTFVLHHEHFEITTFRSESEYINHREPKQVSFTSNLKDDLKRRDFTINAICYDGNDIIDEFHGIDDIQNKLIRAIDTPSKRFEEDALRILRALRFSYTLKFTIEDTTYDAIKNLSHLLSYISKERIQEEFNKMLLSDQKDLMLHLINATVLYEIIPDLKEYEDVPQETPYHIYDVLHHVNICMNQTDGESLEIKLAVLLHDIAKKSCKTIDEDGVAHFKGHAHASARTAKRILKKLHYPNRIQKRVYDLIYYHDYYLSLNLKSVRKFLYKLHGDINLANDILKVQYFDNLGKANHIAIEKNEIIDKASILMKQCIEDKEAFSLSSLAVNGTDMLALGYTQKDVGIVLNRLLIYVLNQQDKNTYEELIKIAGGMKNEIISSN